MSSATTKLKEALIPSRDVVADIAAKIAKARADHAAAERQHRTDALEAATGQMGAATRLETAVEAVRAAEQRIRDLTAAHAEAITQRQESERRNAAGELAARVAAVKKALQASEDDALAVERLVEQLAAAWVKLRKNRLVALASARNSLNGLLFDDFGLSRALAVQIDRVNLRADPHERFPFGLVQNPNTSINPKTVAQGFGERVRAANKRALEIVESNGA